MSNISDFIYKIVDLIGIYGPILSTLLIVIESIFPILPLGVFITINFLYYGNFLGFLLSWFFTVIGCMMSFYLFRKGIQGKFNKLISNRDKLNNFMNRFNNISVSELALIIAIPFTPAFLVNIAAGLSNISTKKFLLSLIIGKIGLVYFWGYIGTNLIESLTNPIILIKIAIILIVTYIVSLIIKKITKI